MDLLVHTFVCRGTVEERIDALIEQKNGLAADLLEAGGETLVTELSDEAVVRIVSLDLRGSRPRRCDRRLQGARSLSGSRSSPLGVELPDQVEQAGGGSLKVGRQLGDLIAQLLELRGGHQGGARRSPADASP